VNKSLQKSKAIINFAKPMPKHPNRQLADKIAGRAALMSYMAKTFIKEPLIQLFMHKIIYLVFFFLLSIGTFAQNNGSTTRIIDPDAGRLFPYPVVPDSKTLLDQRCNYLVYHFWDRANIKQTFSTLTRLQDAFGDWASFMPYATADTVMMSIDRYIASVEKADGKLVPEMVKIAEHWFRGDSAEYASDVLYLPFCKAGARAKKADAATRARYARLAKIIESSGQGHRVPNIQFTDTAGVSHGLDEVIASRVILFFADPDCVDCSLIKARLAADYNLEQMIERGLAKIVVLYDPDSDWQTSAKSCPATWVTGGAANLDEYFELPALPALYYLDGRHRVLAKNVDIDNLLTGLRVIFEQTKVAE